MGIGCELLQKSSSACLSVKVQCHDPLPGELGGRQGWSLGGRQGWSLGITLDCLPTARVLALTWLGKAAVLV